jgi:hypothetical protein
MDARSWRRTIKTEVLPRVPELVLTGSVLHRPDTEWLLCAAVKNDSAFSKGFTVDVIVMPLYEPTDHIGWLVGARLGELTDSHDIWWDPAAQTASSIGVDIAARLRGGALSYWDRLGDLASFEAECRRRPTFESDVHYMEWVAGAGVILGDEATAIAAFTVARRLRPERSWEHAAQARLAELEKTWTADRGAARALLRQRRDQTAAAIGLERRSNA